MIPSIFPIFLSGYACEFHCTYCNCRAVNSCDEIADAQTRTLSIADWAAQKQFETRYVAFYGNDIATLPADILTPYLDEARRWYTAGLIHGIRISARPDTVIRFMQNSDWPVKSVEIGCQSMDDQVLLACGRGHLAADVERAIEYCAMRQIEIGVQTMIGLPGASNVEHLVTAQRLSRMPLDFVRVHPTLVLRHTKLEEAWIRNDYRPLSLGDAVDRCVDVSGIYNEAGIPIARLGYHIPCASLSNVLAAGPYHEAFANLVTGEIAFRLALDYLKTAGDVSIIPVRPDCLNTFIGHNRRNIVRLEQIVHHKIDMVPCKETGIKTGSPKTP